MGEGFGIDWAAMGIDRGVLVVFALLAALLFGLIYNWIADKFRKADMMEFLVGILVVGGVASTIVIGWFFGVIPLKAALVMFGLFVCSGVPMLAGHFIPVIRERMKEKEEIRGDSK